LQIVEQARESNQPNVKSGPPVLVILHSEPKSMSSYAAPPFLQYENIINGILVFSKSLSHGKQIIVAQSTVFDMRDTLEKMVSKSTITLMKIDAGKLDKNKKN